MVQVASNLLSSLPTSQAGRLSGRLTARSAGRGFDQVLGNSSSGNRSEKTETQKKIKSKADESDQMPDAKVKNKPDAVDDQKHHDDLPDAIDTALAASAVEMTQSVEPEALPASGATENAPSANSTATISNPLIEVPSQSTEQGDSKDQSSKQRNVAEAMLRLLGIAAGQGASREPASLTLVEAPASPVMSSVNVQPSALPAGAALSLPMQDDGTMDDANLARVSRALQNVIQQKGGTMTIRMMPPELGQIRVDIQMHGGKVSAIFQTEHQSVQSLMSRELGQLREALQKQGLTVERLEVNPRPASGNASNSSQNESQHQAPSDGRSRGQYMPQSLASEDSQIQTNSREESFETQLGLQSQTL